MYAWGRGEHGRLGFGDDKSSRMVALKVELLAGENIVQVIDLGITGMLLASVTLTFPLRSSLVSHLYYCTFFCTPS